MRIETTRPELLPACVALVAHPDDERYQPLFGTTVRTPLFGVDVPVLAHRLAAPDKGSGIAMICTFGDLTDVIWWRELALPTRAILGVDGRLLPEPPAGVDADAYSRVAGKTVFSAREEIVSMLRESGALEGDPKPITHPVKFYEKGDRPLEIVTSRQWYIRNGGREPELRAALLQRGRDLDWHPKYMQTRYENWVEGLAGDWLVSRQRYFGVPFPIWYRLDAEGQPDYDAPITADEASLPVDPSSECPPGYEEAQRGVPGGFIGDPDVMDTWATSSLSPQIASGWGRDDDLFARVFPMDLRPQAHDIIRTWLFATVVRSHLEHDSLPWAHAAISGFVVDPEAGEDQQVQGQRRRRAGRDPRDLRVGCGALAGRDHPARDRHTVRRGPDEGRPPAGDQGAQRLEVRALTRCDARPRRGDRGRSTLPCSPGSPKVVEEATTSLSRATTTPARWRSPRRSSGRSATTTSSW